MIRNPDVRVTKRKEKGCAPGGKDLVESRRREERLRLEEDDLRPPHSRLSCRVKTELGFTYITTYLVAEFFFFLR
jgi:hypothetical protein